MKLFTIISAAVLLIVDPFGCRADQEADFIVQKAFDYWRGVSSYSEFSMTIHRSDFERTMELRGWTRGRSDALFFVLKPPKDAGNGSLKKGGDMWSYNPKINRAVKLPPSMMSQSWMGSDFSNDDLAKSDTILEDYIHRVIDRTRRGDHIIYTIESTARESAPVVWGKQILTIRDDHILLSEQFFDEDMVLVKEMQAEELVQFSDRLFPKVWTMRRVDEEDRYTRLEYHVLDFNIDIDDRMFSLTGLKRRIRSP